MERVIVNERSAFLRKNGLITKHQHGFLSGRSTTIATYQNFWKIGR